MMIEDGRRQDGLRQEITSSIEAGDQVRHNVIMGLLMKMKRRWEKFDKSRRSFFSEIDDVGLRWFVEYICYGYLWDREGPRRAWIIHQIWGRRFWKQGGEDRK